MGFGNKISRTFQRDIRRARQKARDAAKRFIVVALKKDGTPRKVCHQNVNFQLDATRSREDAERRKAELEQLNPGTRYTIIERDEVS